MLFDFHDGKYSSSCFLKVTVWAHTVLAIKTTEHSHFYYPRWEKMISPDFKLDQISFMRQLNLKSTEIDIVFDFTYKFCTFLSCFSYSADEAIKPTFVKRLPLRNEPIQKPQNSYFKLKSNS